LKGSLATRQHTSQTYPGTARNNRHHEPKWLEISNSFRVESKESS
jgi:hypothetical protein